MIMFKFSKLLPKYVYLGIILLYNKTKVRINLRVYNFLYMCFLLLGNHLATSITAPLKSFLDTWMVCTSKCEIFLQKYVMFKIAFLKVFRQGISGRPKPSLLFLHINSIVHPRFPFDYPTNQHFLTLVLDSKEKDSKHIFFNIAN